MITLGTMMFHDATTHANTNGDKWYLARPVGLGFWDRVKTAWKVLKGDIDGLEWTEQ